MKKMITTLVVLMLVLPSTLMGCSSKGEVEKPSVETAPNASEGAGTNVDGEVDSNPRMDSESDELLPDEEIMASMKCIPLDSGTLEQYQFHFGMPDRAVAVEVGEGLEDGETWWVVAMDYVLADDETRWVRKFYLANALELSDEDNWKWIELSGSNRWSRVEWDRERLIRGQSALQKAADYLDDLVR